MVGEGGIHCYIRLCGKKRHRVSEGFKEGHMEGGRDPVVCWELKPESDGVGLTKDGEGTDVFGAHLTTGLSQTKVPGG